MRLKMSLAEKIVIADAPLRRQDVVAVARFGAPRELSTEAWARIDNAQAIVQRIVDSGARANGVTTGLGDLCNVSLKDDKPRRSETRSEGEEGVRQSRQRG